MYETVDGAGAEHACFTLDGQVDCITEAREHAQRLFQATSPPLPDGLVIDAQLAVAELVTNAVRHAPGPCELEITIDEARIDVAVHDGNREPPAERVPDTTGAGGFGLLMLRRLAGHTTTTLHAVGKTVSVTLPRGRHA